MVHKDQVTIKWLLYAIVYSKDTTFVTVLHIVQVI